jgi:hypothetical protein
VAIFFALYILVVTACRSVLILHGTRTPVRLAPACLPAGLRVQQAVWFHGFVYQHGNILTFSFMKPKISDF